MNLNAHFRSAIDYLDENYAHFLTNVLNMGRPEWNSGVPTAGVALVNEDSGETDFRYIFNPKFAERLTREKLAFVMAHETLHIVLDHLNLRKRFDDKTLFNVAADCVINDYLIDMGFEPPADVMTGAKNVGYNCAQATVRKVYNDLKAQGKTGEDYEKGGAGGQAIDDHGWMDDQGDAGEKVSKDLSDGAQKSEKTPEDLNRKSDEEKGKHSTRAGQNQGALQKFMANKDVGLKWADLMRRINPDVFRRGGPPPKPTFRAPRRKLGAFYPAVNLPIYEKEERGRDGEVPAIVMALDTSGSIPSEDRNRFVNLARSVPQGHIMLLACTFTTVYKELDLKNPEFATGGTSFSAIEEFISDKVKPELKGRYPRAVVVITDGDADFDRNSVPEEFQGRWHWLMTEGHYSRSAPFGNEYKLTDFVK